MPPSLPRPLSWSLKHSICSCFWKGATKSHSCEMGAELRSRMMEALATIPYTSTSPRTRLLFRPPTSYACSPSARRMTEWLSSVKLIFKPTQQPHFRHMQGQQRIHLSSAALAELLHEVRSRAHCVTSLHFNDWMPRYMDSCASIWN